ncbi:S26 family signal peptidase [Isosphaeraceae bacterium EP7]
MARPRRNSRKTKPAVPAAPLPASRPQPPKAKGGWRETVESCVAVALVYLLVGFEAQGFVIPTGSMGPTLMGRHKELACPECGSVFQVNVSEGTEVARGTCGNCRNDAAIGGLPVFQGDRIGVMKTNVAWPGLFGGPKRWEMIVFRRPEIPNEPYIKRLVGLSGEQIRIDNGDIYARPLGTSAPFRRPERSTEHRRGMQMLVHDDSHRAKALRGDPRWDRWTGWSEGPTGLYRPGDAPGWSELRYRHVVPEPDQWAAIRVGVDLPHPPRPTLITDFNAYDTDVPAGLELEPRASSKGWLYPHWVGQLTLALRLHVEQPRGAVRFELIEGGVPLTCEVDLTSGLATLRRGDEPLGEPRPTPIRGAGAYDVEFANVDGRLSLWVDGEAPFGDGIEHRGERVGPTSADLAPVAVASRGASVRVGGLVLSRDLYYTQFPTRQDDQALDRTDPSELFDLLADPDRYASTIKAAATEYDIRPGHSMMLGDNSAWSNDGRSWGKIDQIDPLKPGEGWTSTPRASWEVPDNLLIGKVFAVYWPHLRPFGPDLRLSKDVQLPARPYFERMKWAH